MSVSLNDFKRLRPELVRLRRNQPALDSEARAVVERLPAETLAAMDRWAESERQRRRQVEWDIQVLGQAARDYHAAVNPDYLPPEIGADLPLVSTARGPRQRGAGRPARRRTSRAGAGRDGPSDLDPPPRPLALARGRA
jgi:hypothetical protein